MLLLTKQIHVYVHVMHEDRGTYKVHVGGGGGKNAIFGLLIIHMEATHKNIITFGKSKQL